MITFARNLDENHARNTKKKESNRIKAKDNELS